MNISDYFKRALSEITGRPIKHSHLSINYRMLAVVLLGVFILGFGLLWATRSPGKEPLSCIFRITEADAPRPVTAGDTVQLNTCVQLERVASDSSRMLGLSNRPSLPWDRGMLFDFERPGRYCMWMKDMNFSLDIFWLNEQHEIVAMRREISPDTYPQTFCGPQSARYVVEVNAGVIKAGDLHLGQRLRL